MILQDMGRKKRGRPKAQPSPHVATLLFQIKANKLPEPVAEHRFHATRRWRFDLCWPDRLLAVEVDGGAHIRGRHVRPLGYRKDCEKLNAAHEAGWRVLRYVPEQIKSGEAVNQITRIITGDSP